MSHRKMTRKQRAAALRNLKKARAARKGMKSRKGGKLCFESIRSTANYLKRHGFKVVRK